MQTQSLVQSLRDLISAYELCITRTEELIAALVAADLIAMRAAISAHSISLQCIDQAEMRRRLAVRGLTYTLLGGSAQSNALAAGLTGPVTFTALLRYLSPEEAAPLSEARRALLITVLRLQVLQRRAATLAQTGQTVLQRTMRVALGANGERYDTSGEQALPASALSAQQGRWA